MGGIGVNLRPSWAKRPGCRGVCPPMGGHNPLKKLVFSPFHQRGKGVGGMRESGRCLKLTPMGPGG